MAVIWSEGFESFEDGDLPYPWVDAGGGAAVDGSFARTGTKSLSLDGGVSTLNIYGTYTGPVKATGWTYLTGDEGQEGNSPDLTLVSKDYAISVSWLDNPFFDFPWLLAASDNLFSLGTLAVSDEGITEGWHQFTVEVDGSTPPTATVQVYDSTTTLLFGWTGEVSTSPGVGAIFGLTIDENEWVLATDTSLLNWWDDLSVEQDVSEQPRLVRMYPVHN